MAQIILPFIYFHSNLYYHSLCGETSACESLWFPPRKVMDLVLIYTSIVSRLLGQIVIDVFILELNCEPILYPFN